MSDFASDFSSRPQTGRFCRLGRAYPNVNPSEISGHSPQCPETLAPSRAARAPIGSLPVTPAKTTPILLRHRHFSVTAPRYVALGMARILVIEDEPDIREVLGYNLRSAGHDVIPAERGKEGLTLAREQRPDLVLLDLMLPDVSGTEVCRAIKDDPSTRAMPVVVLTARNSEIDRVVGFELGADDYVTKPFSVRELLLRIRAVLRRIVSRPVEANLVDFGTLRVDGYSHRVWVDGV